MEDAWLLVKRGLYYMPGGNGYTGVRARAGRYTEAEAKAHAYDPGKNGNPVTMIRLSEAAEFSDGCHDGIALSVVTHQRDKYRGTLEAIADDETTPPWLRTLARVTISS